jgi:hypothetical protein
MIRVDRKPNSTDVVDVLADLFIPRRASGTYGLIMALSLLPKSL